MRLTVRFNTVERGRARLSTVEHGRETVEIRYTAVQRGSFNRTLPRSTAARWDLGISKVHIYRYLGYGLNKTRIPLVLDLNGVVCTIYKFAPIPKYVCTYLCTYIVFIYVRACVCVFCVWCVLTQRYTRRSHGNADHMIRTNI